MKIKKKKLGFVDISPQFMSDVMPPEPVAATEQIYDETLSPVGIAPLDSSSFTIENISYQLKSQSPIAKAAAEKLATIEQSVSQAEIKVSKNLNPYVIALGVVVGLLIIDKLIMKDGTAN
jgi:hypothetical protein